MDEHDRPCPWRDRRLDEVLVQVEGIAADINEDEPRAGADKRRRRRDEGERGDDHLVAFGEVEQKARHFEGVGARGGQQDLAASQRLLEELRAPGRKRAVAVDVAAEHRLPHVLEFVCHQYRQAELDRRRVLGCQGLDHRHQSKSPRTIVRAVRNRILASSAHDRCATYSASRSAVCAKVSRLAPLIWARHASPGRTAKRAR